MLDSGSDNCYDTPGYCGPTVETTQWFQEQVEMLVEIDNNIAIHVFMHIPMQEMLLMNNLETI